MQSSPARAQTPASRCADDTAPNEKGPRKAVPSQGYPSCLWIPPAGNDYDTRRGYFCFCGIYRFPILIPDGGMTSDANIDIAVLIQPLEDNIQLCPADLAPLIGGQLHADIRGSARLMLHIVTGQSC